MEREWRERQTETDRDRETETERDRGMEDEQNIHMDKVLLLKILHAQSVSISNSF